MVNLFRKDFPPEKKDSKHLIEQLLMQETFSRYGDDFFNEFCMNLFIVSCLSSICFLP